MFRALRVRANANSLVSLTLTLAVMIGWIGSHNSSGAAADRVASPAGSSASRATPSALHEATGLRVVESYGRLPLSFEANTGQADSQVDFISRGLGYDLFLTSTEAIMIMIASARSAPAASTQSVLRMQVVGANPQAQVAGLDQLPGIANYLVGDDPTRWRTKVPTYAKVRYRGVYDGVDLVYYGNNRELEYDFVVAPGADPGRIRLRFEGAEHLRIDPHGELVLGVRGAEVRQRRPVIYQAIDGQRREVAGSYVLKADGGEVGFKVADYDPSVELVIDPVLVYSTYFGGTGNDIGYGIAVDSAGNAYVTGQTTSLNFSLASPLQPAPAGNIDAFVTKINASGTAIDYSTYLGGNNIDIGRGIAVDPVGNALVTGETRSSNFPLLNPRQPSIGGGDCAGFPCQDAFVTKLSQTGTLVYSTYLGGSDLDIGHGIAADSAGNAYVTGRTAGGTFPVVSPMQAPAGFDDAFVTKISPSGNAIIYSTPIGGNGFDYALGIAVDSSGSAYITGHASSPNFPTGGGVFNTHRGGGSDAFVTKITTSGQGLVYSTFLGGSSEERGYAIAVDGSGSALVTGLTASLNFPTFNVLQSGYGGGTYDAFVTKLSPSGSSLVYSTFVGGNQHDYGYGIAVDSVGAAYVTGLTSSANFPLADPLQPMFGGSSDAFVMKCDASGTLIYSTYLGGSREPAGVDAGNGIAVDAQGDAYVTGQVGSFHFPVVSPLQPSLGLAGGGVPDAFVAKFGSNPAVVAPVRVTLARDAARAEGRDLQASVILTNPFSFPVEGVTVTLVRGSTLDRRVFVDGVPVSQSFGTINPGQSVAAIVTFPFTAFVPAGFQGLVRVDLSFAGGTFSDTKVVTSP